MASQTVGLVITVTQRRVRWRRCSLPGARGPFRSVEQPHHARCPRAARDNAIPRLVLGGPNGCAAHGTRRWSRFALALGPAGVRQLRTSALRRRARRHPPMVQRRVSSDVIRAQGCMRLIVGTEIQRLRHHRKEAKYTGGATMPTTTRKVRKSPLTIVPVTVLTTRATFQPNPGWCRMYDKNARKDRSSPGRPADGSMVKNICVALWRRRHHGREGRRRPVSGSVRDTARFTPV